MNTTPTSKIRPFGLRLVAQARALLAVSALAALAVPSRSFAQTPTFNTLVSTPKGGEPWFRPAYAAVGDFNGDGKPDAIVTDGSYNGVVRLMLGNGDGTFAQSNVNVSASPTNPTPGVIKAADLNGDGRLDAIFVSPQGNLAPTVMLNTGNDASGVPQFAVTIYAGVYSGLRSLAVGDLNGDGRPDFIAGNAYGNIYVYLNNGSGAFTVAQTTTLMPNVGGSTGPGVIADLNGDGKADYVVTSNQTGAINIFFGNGDGTLQAPVVIPASTTSMAVADLNADGKPDLLTVANSSPNQLLVYLNTGSGSFGPPAAYSTGGSAFNGWTSVTTADLNGDGKLDVVAANSGSNNVAMFEGNGTGTFGTPTFFAVNMGPFDVSVGDFNRDGKPDIATAGQNDLTYGVLLNTTVPALPTQNLTILGGSGNPGDIAANVEYYNPLTGLWQPAYLTSYAAYGHPVTHPWGNIAGTNRWINYRTNGGSDPAASESNTLWYLYRVRFTVPSDAVDPKMTFSLKADNRAQVAINGVNAGPMVVGEADQLNADAIFSRNVLPGVNTITLNVGDEGGLNGFNFRIDLSMKSSAPLEIVPVKADATPPVITAPADIVAEATGAGGRTVTFAATAIDAVDGPVNVVAVPRSGSLFALGTSPVGLSAADAAGNTAEASFLVTVRDTLAPVVTAPASFANEATAATGAVVTYPPATATDAVGVASLTYSQNSGTLFPLGATAVTAIAKDAAGNTGTGAFTVTVRDTTPPALTLPASQTREATSASGAVATFTASATDLVGVTSLTYGAASGSTFPLGTTTVTVTAKDAAGNTTTGSFTVTVVDTTAPALTLPASQTREATSAGGATATFTASATDLVGVTSLTYGAASGSTFPLGTTTVTVTAKDAAGNTTTGSFTVTVVDTTAPALASVTPSSATLWPPNHQMVAIRVTADATDAVGLASLKIIRVTSNEPDNGLGDGDTAGDIEITGNLTVNLRAERSGKGEGRIYTLTVEARDAAGNATTKTCTVSVPKSQGKN